jgi:hypothetical protein
MLHMAERFWKSVPSSEAILAKLAKVPGEARTYCRHRFLRCESCIVLVRMLRGDTEARLIADGVLSRLSGEQRLERISPVIAGRGLIGKFKSAWRQWAHYRQVAQ